LCIDRENEVKTKWNRKRGCRHIRVGCNTPQGVPRGIFTSPTKEAAELEEEKKDSGKKRIKRRCVRGTSDGELL